MQDAIQPLHRLSFTHLNPGGVFSIEANPVAPTVYALTSQTYLDASAAALAWWPWLLTPLAAVLLVFTLWRMRRILTRRQRRGSAHCRRCNYELVGVPSLCPECGCPTTPRDTITGRSTFRRLAPLALPFTALLFITGLGVALALGWTPQLHQYPSPTAKRITDALGISAPPALLLECNTIIEVDLATGRTLRTVIDQLPPFAMHFEVAPRGDAIVTSGGNSFSGW